MSHRHQRFFCVFSCEGTSAKMGDAWRLSHIGTRRNPWCQLCNTTAVEVCFASNSVANRTVLLFPTVTDSSWKIFKRQLQAGSIADAAVVMISGDDNLEHQLASASEIKSLQGSLGLWMTQASPPRTALHVGEGQLFRTLQLVFALGLRDLTFCLAPSAESTDAEQIGDWRQKVISKVSEAFTTISRGSQLVRYEGETRKDCSSSEGRFNAAFVLLAPPKRDVYDFAPLERNFSKTSFSIPNRPPTPFCGSPLEMQVISSFIPKRYKDCSVLCGRILRGSLKIGTCVDPVFPDPQRATSQRSLRPGWSYQAHLFSVQKRSATSLASSHRGPIVQEIQYFGKSVSDGREGELVAIRVKHIPRSSKTTNDLLKARLVRTIIPAAVGSMPTTSAVKPLGSHTTSKFKARVLTFAQTRMTKGSCFLVNTAGGFQAICVVERVVSIRSTGGETMTKVVDDDDALRIPAHSSVFVELVPVGSFYVEEISTCRVHDHKLEADTASLSANALPASTCHSRLVLMDSSEAIVGLGLVYEAWYNLPGEPIVVKKWFSEGITVIPAPEDQPHNRWDEFDQRGRLLESYSYSFPKCSDLDVTSQWRGSRHINEGASQTTERISWPLWLIKALMVLRRLLPHELCHLILAFAHLQAPDPFGIRGKQIRAGQRATKF